jgi:GAF domain-containing protein
VNRMSKDACRGRHVRGNDGGDRALIERLCAVCVSEAGVDGGGISLLTASMIPFAVHATDALSARIEDLQFTIGQGPCVDASRDGAPVLVADLISTTDEVLDRWPIFVAEARQFGVRAIFAFPVRIGDVALGVVELYRGRPGPLTAVQLSRTLSTVDNLGWEVLDLDGHQPGGDNSAYPMTVHQAAGMVTVQLGCSIDEALVRLRAAAFVRGRPVAGLAAEIVARRTRLSEE